MAAEKSRKSSDEIVLARQPRPILQPFDRLRRFKRVKGYLKEYDGSRFAMLEVTENDYKTLCCNSSRIVLSEAQQLPKNDRLVKIFLRKNDDDEDGNKENVDKNDNQKSAPSSSSAKKILSKKVNFGPPSFAAPSPSTPRPQKRQNTFGLEQQQTDE
uniref:Uncharacterized protein n=1 Tax=Panagrolaimus sp. ES5 TaxID=591445 RepID=A0AC34GU87_9BILA